MKVLFPPEAIIIRDEEKSVFLAGSIDLGKAQEWQNELVESLKDWEGVVLNPRRPDWDSGWSQSIDHPQFYEQVNWELEGLEKADLIVYYFAPGSQAPVTLLELGLYAKSGKAVVCCPSGYWRKGNIDIVCQRYGIRQVENLEKLREEIEKISG